MYNALRRGGSFMVKKNSKQQKSVNVNQTRVDDLKNAVREVVTRISKLETTATAPKLLEGYVDVKKPDTKDEKTPSHPDLRKLFVGGRLGRPKLNNLRTKLL